MKFINNYIGTYRVFQEITIDGKPSDNTDATFLKCKYNSQMYRYNNKTLALHLTTGNSIKNVIPQLEVLGVKLELFVEGNSEAVYLFPEKQISLVAEIIKPMTKGKNIKPKSVKNVRRLEKDIKKK